MVIIRKLNTKSTRDRKSFTLSSDWPGRFLFRVLWIAFRLKLGAILYTLSTQRWVIFESLVEEATALTSKISYVRSLWRYIAPLLVRFVALLPLLRPQILLSETPFRPFEKEFSFFKLSMNGHFTHCNSRTLRQPPLSCFWGGQRQPLRDVALGVQPPLLFVIFVRCS